MTIRFALSRALASIAAVVVLAVCASRSDAQSALDRLFDTPPQGAQASEASRNAPVPLYGSGGTYDLTGPYGAPAGGGYPPDPQGYGAGAPYQGTPYQQGAPYQGNPGAPGGGAPMAEWTFMVYMAADNNLDAAALRDIREMEKVGSTDRVRVVVFLDRERGWQTSRHALIQRRPNSDLLSLDPSQPTTQDLGDLDSGNPETLTRFVSWATQTWPARRYALVIWNHGDGWRSLGDQTVLDTRAIASDDTSGSKMYMRDVRQALERSGARLDLIAMDACLMGMIEVAWELKDLSPLLVAAAHNIPTDGYEYTGLLGDLVQNPAMDAGGLSRSILQSFGRFYQGHSRPLSLTAIDNRQLPALTQSLNELIQVIAREGGNTTLVGRISVQETFATPGKEARRINGNTSHVDLGIFLSEVARLNTVSPPIREAAQRAQEAYGRTIVDHYRNMASAGTGLAIFLPTSSAARHYGDYTAQHSRFAQDSLWPQFIQAYSRNIPLQLPGLPAGPGPMGGSPQLADPVRPDPMVPGGLADLGPGGYGDPGFLPTGGGYDDGGYAPFSGGDPVFQPDGGPMDYGPVPIGGGGGPQARIASIFLTQGNSGAQLVSSIRPGRVYWLRVRSRTSGARPGLHETVSIGLNGSDGRPLLAQERFKTYNFTNGDYIYTFRFRLPSSVAGFHVVATHIVSDRGGRVVSFDRSRRGFRVGGEGFGLAMGPGVRSAGDDLPPTLSKALEGHMEAPEGMKMQSDQLSTGASDVGPWADVARPAPSGLAPGHPATPRERPPASGASALDYLFRPY